MRGRRSHTPTITISTSYDAVFDQVQQITLGSDTTTYTYIPTTDPINAGRVQSVSFNGTTTYTSYNTSGKVQNVWGDTYPLWYEYDALGRMAVLHRYQIDGIWSSSTWPVNAGAGSTTSWLYYPSTNLFRQKLDAAGYGPIYTYDAAGNMQTRTWARQANGHPIVTTYSHNLQGELTGTSYSDNTPGVTYAHDAFGNVLTLTDASGSHTMSYTAGLNQLWTVSGLANGASLQYTFDSNGRPTGYTFTDHQNSANSASVIYQYDSATGLLNAVNSGSGGAAYQPTSDGNFLNQWYGPPGGRQLGIQRQADAQGRLSTATTFIGPIDWTFGSDVTPHTAIGYGYDARGRRESMSRNENTWIYGYDARNEVTSGYETNPSAATVAGTNYSYAYDAIGNRITTAINGATAGYTPNALNEYANRAVPGRAEILGKVIPNSQHNSAGTLADLVVGVNGRPVTPDAYGHFYDAIPVNNATAPQWVNTRVIAALKGAGSGGTDVVTLETGNIYVPQTPEQFAYDLDGNLTQDGRWSYAWDAENRLVGVESIPAAVAAGAPNLTLTFAYDAQGRRISKTMVQYSAAGTAVVNSFQRQFAYDGWNLVAEFSTDPNNPGSPGSLLRSYLWGLDMSGALQSAGGIGGLLAVTQNIAEGATSSGTYYPVYDGNGNVIEYHNFNNSTQNGYFEYGPFGEAVRASGPAAALPFQFSTKYKDTEWDGSNFGYRYLKDARWISRDLKGEGGGKNLYAYVQNSPENSVDPLGLCKKTLVVTSGPDIGQTAYQFGTSGDNAKVKDWAKSQLGYVPSKLTYVSPGPFMTKEMVLGWEKAALVELVNMGKPCKSTIHVDYAPSRYYSDAASQLGKPGDAFVLFGHGGSLYPGPDDASNPTGIIFEIGTPPVGPQYAVGAPIPLSYIVGGSAPSVNVASCRDAYLPHNVGQIGILTLGINTTYEQDRSAFFASFKRLVQSLCSCDD